MKEDQKDQASLNGSIARSFAASKLLQIWFKHPIKFFRPYAVDPWQLIRGKQVKAKLVLKTVPILAYNGAVGFALFHTYSQVNKHHNPWISGCCAGTIHSVLCLPFERPISIKKYSKILLRDSLGFALFFGVFEQFKRPQESRFLNALFVLGSGFLAGTCYQFVRYPLVHGSLKGIQKTLIRTVSPSAIGLFLYEMTKEMGEI